MTGKFAWTCRRGPGRPVQLEPEERESRVLDAAARLLAEAGTQGASMTAIAREAGMSKRTLYELFGNRECLVAACVRRVRSSLVRPLTDEQAELPLADRLRLLLTPDVCVMEDTTPREILRTAIAEARTRPEVARSLLEEGFAPLVAAIRDELARAVEKGEIAVPDVDAAATLLRDMVYSNPIDKLLNPESELPSAERVVDRLNLAIDVFLHGVATETD